MEWTSPTLREVLAFITGLIPAIPSWVIVYRQWKRTGIEDRKLEAEIDLTEESVVSVRRRDDLATAEGVGKMLASMIETGENLSQLQRRLFDLEQDQIELQLARQDIKQLKGLLDAHGISYSEKDQARTEPPKVRKGNGVVYD